MKTLESAFSAVLGGAGDAGLVEALLCEAPWLAFRNWQVQPLVYDALGRPELRDDGDALKSFVDSSIAIEAFSQVQLRSLASVCDSFEAASLFYSLLKSSAVRLECYEDPVQRTGWDIDVAVERNDIGRAAEVLNDLGFHFAQFNPKTRRFAPADPLHRAAVEAGHYELGFLVRRNRVNGLSDNQARAIRNTLSSSRHWHLDDDDQLCCYTTVDVHHGLSLEITTSQLLDSARLIGWETRKARVPSLAWLGFHVIYKLYWEGVHAYGKGLYQYADVCRIARRMKDSDVDELIALIDAANIRAGAFYVLRRLPTSFGVSLPARLADYIQSCGRPEGEDPIACNDLGDMWEKVWGRR